MNRIYRLTNKKKNLRFFLADDHRNFINTYNEEILHYLNKHNYAEIHMISQGEAVCNVNGKPYTLCAGDAILIPAGSFHSIDVLNRKHHDAFQVDVDAKNVVLKHFPAELIETLFERWGDKNENAINYLTFICNELTAGESFVSEENSDDKFVIADYIEANYYRDASLKNLAKHLHLSEMQTQRLVKKHMGKSFGKCLREHRIVIAEFLMNNSDLTRDEIARYVGYGSYNGFWKARQKYYAEKKEA